MVKFMFIGYRKPGLSRDQYFAEWEGDAHVSMLREVAGVRKWVQNRVTGESEASRPDGIGELWFDSTESMHQALLSPEMVAAFEDGKRFVDLDRSYGLYVDEKVVIE